MFRFSRLTFFVFAFLLVQACHAADPDSERLFLTGKGNDDGVPWEFFCSAGRQSGNWTTIKVPSCWQSEGFGSFGYKGDTEPFEKGQYRRTFTVPAAWNGRRVQVVFEGVMTDANVRINGQSAGPMHQGAFYRFAYDITKLLMFGAENRIEVDVDKHSANKSVNAAEREADYWNFAGIFRPVYLESLPQSFIARVAINAQADGTFSLDAVTANAQAGDRLEAQLHDASGAPAGEPFSAEIGAANSASTKLTTKLANARTWTAETPNLYTVEVTLVRGGNLLHRFHERFGFRTMEFRVGDGFYVNGSRVILKGCCRHSFWPESGRCTSEKITAMDVELIKEMNMNAVRMSHYPPDQHFLDECDEKGLYVLDELGGWQKSYDTEIGKTLVEAMVCRDVNHPSILFWDNGNEGGWNTELDDEFAKWDPQQRPVIHPWSLFRNLQAKHYPLYKEVEKIAEGPDVFMFTEFTHALYDGGGGAGLRNYWDLMRSSKFLGGGFIWAYVDEATKRPDLDGKLDAHGNNAPDGIVGPHREKEGSFFTIKEIWSPVVVKESELPKPFTGQFTIENRYSFIDTARCKFHWELRKFDGPFDAKAGFTLLAQGTADSPSIPPGTSGPLKCPVPAEIDSADALALRIEDPNGKELWTYVWAVPANSRSRVVPKFVAANDPRRVSANETVDAIVVSTQSASFKFSKADGRLAEVRRGTATFSLGNGPRLADGDSALTKISHHPSGNDGSRYVIEATYSGDLKTVRWTVRADGWIRLDYACHFNESRPFAGISFDYPESKITGKRWLGMGPYRVWQNRLEGGQLNVWENALNEGVTGEEWVYPEFKGYFSDVRWVRLDTAEGPILAVPGISIPYVQILRPRFPHEPAKTVAAFPEASLSFLYSIPPVGSKNKPADSTGPQGRNATLKGEYKGDVTFYFGQ